MPLALPYRYISAEELAQIIKSKPDAALKEVAVVDVRDRRQYRSGAKLPQRTVPRVGRWSGQEVGGRTAGRVPGPKAARIYAETRTDLLPSSTPQEILVLRNGFSGFQAKYRSDPALIEKFNKYYHD
ncbi:hypothetical protein P7C73_g5289, partial [Tremellales sp. Uapishka_1]